MGWRPSPHRVAVVQGLLVVAVWASSWILIKVGLREIPPVSFGGLRYGLPFLCLLPLLACRPRLRSTLRMLSGGDLMALAGYGVVFYAVTQGAQFVALAQLPAATVSLVLGATPALVAVSGVLLLGERLSVTQWAGLGVYLVGVGLYLGPAAVPAGAGVAVVAALVQLLANSGSALLGRAINRRGQVPALVVTVVSMGVGSIVLLGVGLALHGLPRLSAAGWWITAWLAVVNTALAFSVWNHTLRRLSAAQSSAINTTMVVHVAVLAWIFLGERLSGLDLAGLVVAVVGVAVVQLRPHAP